MFIVYLKYAEAAKVAQTLRAMLTGGDGGSRFRTAHLARGRQTLAGSMASGTGPTELGAARCADGSDRRGGAGIRARVLRERRDDHCRCGQQRARHHGPEPIYNNLRAIIEKLDVRRAQVFVEALIVEVSADKAAEFGIQWQALTGYNTTSTRVIGGTNFTPQGSGNNIIDVADQSRPRSGQGLALGVMRGTVTIPGLGTIANLAFLARALETQVGANILSTPTLLTLDNEEARILVGQNIPARHRQLRDDRNTTTVTPFQTFERKDVGLLLRVKPQITRAGRSA
jgi:general secretion pathway protein D